MSAMENIDAEQLCYTWSDVGLSTIHAGFRIRAASPGLSEIYSERVKSMDRHMRYALPPGTDRFAITPEMAPVCLALIRTDWNNEYILVHKNYAGEDGVGRLGNFFVHVIALGDLPFSAADAIWLWDSDLWKTKDKQLDRRSNKLDPIPLKTLQSQVDNFRPNFAKVQQYLPFVIEAYLTRKNKAPLYIAASADNLTVIALLIAGLSLWLPRQLVAGLTFSTYEPDVTKASTEIVGTSWIPTSGKGSEATQIFSPQFYRENLAVNCYTGDRSPLQEHTQIIHKPLAADFAAYATECLITNNTKDLEDLLELAEKSQALDVDTFLRMYYNEIANTDSIGEADIDKALADPGLYLERLSSQNFRKRIIECAAANRQWSNNQLYPRLRVLCNHAQKEYNAALSSGQQYLIDDTSGAIISEPTQIGSPSLQGARRGRNGTNTPTKKNQKTLAQALFMLAERAIPDIVKAMKSVGAERQPVSAQGGTTGIERQKKTEAVASLLSLMDCCLLPQNSLKVWSELFEQIIEHPNRNTIAFMTTQWGVFFWLLKKWDSVFPIQPEYDNALRPLLIIPWNQLGEFLKLNVRQKHKQWNVMAVEKLIQDASLTPQIAQGLEQNYSTEINNLLAQLLQETNFTIVTSFVTRLIEYSYPVRSQFAALIENLLAQLVRNPQLWTDAKNLVVTLTRSGYMGSPSYQDMVETLLSTLLKMQAQGQDLFNVLVDFGYPRKKNLVDILLRSGTSMLNLESVIERVYRTPEELNAFFINDGSNYLSTPDQVRAMKALYRKLLPFPQKVERLFVLLDTPLHEKTILELLNITALEGYEPVRILERYGNSYLKTFQQAPQLANKVVEWYIQLVTSGYPDRFKLLCTLFTSATDYKLLDALLSSAQLTLEESREFFKEYGSLPRYFPFFYQSTTIIALFSRLAQRANTLAANSQTELAMEKLNLLFIWLQTLLAQPPFSHQIVEKLLQAASLTPNEQIAFLERYGAVCLSHYPQLSLLKEYISTYINAFNADSLERAEMKSFFIFLARKYQGLDLDARTQDSIQNWMIIDSYFTSPAATPERLQALARALVSLMPSNNSGFTTKLALAFVSCVRKSDELSEIMHFMQLVTKVQEIQLLYIMAEQVAAQYHQQQNLILLLPYLSFVPDITQEQQEHFAKEFFDTLLYGIDVRDLNQWRTLDAQLMHPATSHEAQEQWHNYLRGLQLLDKLHSVEVIENNVPVPEPQHQPSTPIASDSKPASWLAHVPSVLKSDSPDYRVAKNALDRALGSKQVDIIAATWRQYGTIIETSHPERIKPPQRKKIEVSCAFAQYCQDAAKTSLITFELAKKIVQISIIIENLELKPSSYQQECIRNARMQLQPGGLKQPYQNPERIQSGTLPGYNNSSSIGQASTSPTGEQNKPETQGKQAKFKPPWKREKPLQLGTSSAPSDISEQQSSSNGIKFNDF